MFAHLLAYIICRPAAKGSRDSEPVLSFERPFLYRLSWKWLAVVLILPLFLATEVCLNKFEGEGVTWTGHGNLCIHLCLGLSQLLFFWVFVTDLLFLLLLRLGEANFHLLTQYYNRTHWSRIACVSRLSAQSLGPQDHYSLNRLWARHISVHTSMATILCRALVPEDSLLGSAVKCSAHLPSYLGSGYMC